MAKRANGSTQSKGKKGRKFGRNTEWCKVYRASNKRLSNKIKKLTKHIKNMPNDLQAKRDYMRLNKHVL